MIGERARDIVADARAKRLGDDLDRYRAAAVRLVFGDRTGATLWLGVVLLLGLGWRIGFFITDTYPIANAVENLAAGRLAMQPTDFQYSLTLGTQPGLHRYDGAFYARNYGAVATAVPLLWLLEGLSFVAPPRLVLAGAWSLGVLWLGRELARRLDRSALRSVASVIALATFLVTTAFATELGRTQLALAALQLSTLFAAGLVAVFCYRLASTLHGQRIGVAAGIGLALATPVGFWATIPKRHVLVTALVFASVYAFARSRQIAGVRSDLALGTAYGMLGLLAWVHAFEGFFLTASLFVVDVVTEPRKGKRRIAVVAGVFCLSMLPMAVTNALISGNPLQPPRLLPNVGPGGVELAPEPPGDTGGADSGSGSGGSSGGGSGSGGSGSSGGDASGSGGIVDGFIRLLDPLFGSLSFVTLLFSEVVFIGNYALDTVTDGLGATQKFDTLWNVFVRRGYYEYGGSGLATNDFEAIDLTVLESTPVIGALVALPAVIAVRLRNGVGSLGRLSPGRQTDLLVAVYIGVLVVVYMPRLPLFSQLTVRYLLPAIALASYCVIRLGPIRDAVEETPRLLTGVYAGVVLVGTVAIGLVLGWLDPALGEAIQFHALLNLAATTLLGLLVTVRVLWPARLSPGPVAAGLGVAGGVTTSYIVLASVEYFQYGAYAFDFVRIVARHVPIL